MAYNMEECMHRGVCTGQDLHVLSKHRSEARAVICELFRWARKELPLAFKPCDAETEKRKFLLVSQVFLHFI